MYIIKDWAGNILNYKGKFDKPCFAVAMEFKNEDEAFEYLDLNYSSEDKMELWVSLK
jgi:hypothetical protein